MAKTISPKSRPLGKELTAERLRQLLDYDTETGIFTWRRGLLAKNSHEGKAAGASSKAGAVVIRIDYRMYHAGRLAWLHVHGEWPKRFIDHINRNRADNSLINLREANRSQNAWNRGLDSRNVSGSKGVGLVKATGKWRAIIGYRGKSIFLGGFPTKEEAIKAYADAAARLHGEFSQLG